MSEPSEWAMEKARKVFKQLWVTDHGCDDVSEQRQTQDVFAIARALDEVVTNAKTIKEMQAENEALREALKPFADMCDEIESCAAEYPADHPASDPNEWFTGCVEWPAWRRAKALYEGVIK